METMSTSFSRTLLPVWAQTAELDLGQNSDTGLTLGHPSGNGLPVPDSGFASVNAAVYVAPCAAGVAISSDGTNPGGGELL